MPLLVAQIDDDLHGAIRKNTLEAMVGVKAFMKPKHLDELVERRSRDVSGVDHGRYACKRCVA
jgi:hypothetical protein